MPFGCAPWRGASAEVHLAAARFSPGFFGGAELPLHIPSVLEETSHSTLRVVKQVQKPSRRVLLSWASRADGTCGQESQVLETGWDPADRVQCPAHMVLPFCEPGFCLCISSEKGRLFQGAVKPSPGYAKK